MTQNEARTNWKNLFSKETQGILPEQMLKGKEIFLAFHRAFHSAPGSFNDVWNELPVREQLAWVEASKVTGQGSAQPPLTNKQKLEKAQEEATVDKLVEKALKDALRGDNVKAGILSQILPVLYFLSSGGRVDGK